MDRQILASSHAHREEAYVPERTTNRGYKEHDMWRVDYAGGVIEDNTSEEATFGADEAFTDAG
jgi:hypothetical protein